MLYIGTVILEKFCVEVGSGCTEEEGEKEEGEREREEGRERE